MVLILEIVLTEWVNERGKKCQNKFQRGKRGREREKEMERESGERGEL